MRGQAPYEIEFQWVYGPPIPVGLEPAARKAMIDKRVREMFEQGHAAPQGERTPRSDSPGTARCPSWDCAGNARWRGKEVAPDFNWRPGVKVPPAATEIATLQAGPCARLLRTPTRGCADRVTAP